MCIRDSVYSELKDNGCYFVDKTPYLKELIDKDKSNVMLFTRPRRFGKTLFMSIVEYFFENKLGKSWRHHTSAKVV